MGLFDVFKKPATKTLPIFKPITIEEIPPASAILFYGGNKLTELVGNRIYKHPYRPPSFHAAFYIKDGIFLNVGKFKTIQPLVSELRSSRRIDIIIYKNMDDAKRERLCKTAILDADKPHVGIELPTYAITDYLRFGLRWFKPSKKDFCSENVQELFSTENIKISDQEAFNCAPWDMEEYADAFPDLCEQRTLWVGSDYKF